MNLLHVLLGLVGTDLALQVAFGADEELQGEVTALLVEALIPPLQVLKCFPLAHIIHQKHCAGATIKRRHYAPVDLLATLYCL